MSCSKQMTILEPPWVEYWTLDETSGNRVGKIYLTELAPTVPPPSYATGIKDNCAKFLGTDDALVSLSNYATDLFFATGSFSMAGWVYVDSYASSSTLSLNWIFSDIAGNELRFRLQFNDFGTTQLGMTSDAGGSVTYAFAKPAIGGWHFYHAYYNSATQKIGLQIDGGAAVETDASAVVMVVPVEAYVDLARGATVNNPELEGRIDEVGLMIDRVLTKAQADWLYNSGAGRTYPEVNYVLLH